MSYQATKFVAERTDLTPSEKAVAFVLAFHADKDNAEAYPAMARIASEAGLKTERGARLLVRRLESKQVIRAASPKTGGRGRDKATVYRFNLDVTMDDKTRNASSGFCDQKPGTKLPETRNGRSQNPEQNDRKPGTCLPPNSKELKRSESECDDTRAHFNNSQDGYEEERSTSKPTTDQITSTVIKNQAVYGTEEWARQQAESWPDDKKALTLIANIELKGNRRFESNPKLRAAVKNCLAMDVPWRKVVDAAEQFATRVSDKDRLPGLTLADNLENIVWLTATPEEQAQANG